MDDLGRSRHSVTFMPRGHRAHHAVLDEDIAMMALHGIGVAQTQQFCSTRGLTGGQVH